MDIIKGQSVSIISTVYSNWTGNPATSTIADITGSTIKMYVKVRETDLDAAAVLTLNGAVTDGPNGICTVPIAASDTNALSYTDIFYEIVVKLADGTYQRNGVQLFNLKPNLGKTLF